MNGHIAEMISPLIKMIMPVTGEDGEITATHLLLGIWSEVESAGHKILETLGFDDEKAKELAKTVRLNLCLFYFSCLPLTANNFEWNVTQMDKDCDFNYK